MKLGGLWEGYTFTEEEITAVRREAWAGLGKGLNACPHFLTVPPGLLIGSWAFEANRREVRHVNPPEARRNPTPGPSPGVSFPCTMPKAYVNLN